MSAPEAKAALINILNEALKANTRQVLDKEVQIVDLNKDTILSAYRLKADAKDFDKAYDQFITVIDNIFASQQRNYTVEEAITIVGQPEAKVAVIWISSEKYLICSGFSSASTIRTKIYRDKALVGNPYFGVANRSRSIYKHLQDKGIILDESSIRGTIPDESTLTSLVQSSKSARNSIYIFPEMTKDSTNSTDFMLYQLVTSKKDGKNVGALIPYTDKTKYKFVAVQDITGEYEFYPIETYIGYKVYAKNNTVDIAYYPEEAENALVLDKRLLSVADVGHAYFIDRATGRTPAGSKLNIPDEIIDVFKNSPTQLEKVNSIIASLKQQLNKAHGAVDFTFYKKQLQDQINGSQTLNTRINNCVVVTFQNYKVNSDLGRIESQILATLKREIINELLNIPGSNTLKQDLAEAAINKVIEPLLKLNNKLPKKLKTTSNIRVKKPFVVKTGNIKQSKGSFSKLTTSSNNAVNLPIPTLKVKTNNVSAQTTNLTSLQNLINASLVERVKQNMGTGNRRDVLNLRTGRFAESVKVERMTESRQGMITAFYSYMKNPYATFSQGGAQDTPKSRDPKLLIAKSIREIAAQQVANRLRSVSV